MASEPAFTFNTGDEPNVLRFAVTQVFGGDFGLDYLATITYKESSYHFQVTVQPDTISYSETAVITVQAKDDNGEDFIIPDDTEVDFLLNVNGELYGNLIAPDGTQDNRFSGITYADARAGQVKYIANGEVPTDWAEPPIQIEVL